jgi:F0F1-type ATP synthase assembly protein I
MSKTNKVAASSANSKSQMSDFELSMQAKNQFIVTTMNMSWQLAVVVLVPLLGGHYIDQKFSTGYLFFGIGFVLALIGMSFIVWRQIKLIKPLTERNQKGKINDR